MSKFLDDEDYFLNTYKTAAHQISQEIKKIDGLIADRFPKNDPLRAEAARFVTEGGKRFRPSLSLVVAQAYGQLDVWPHLALEVFHKYILMHDDIIDLDDMRYGRPTVHAKLALTCPQKGDEARHFGHALALVAGDLTAAATNKVIFSSSLSPTKKVQLVQLIDRAMDEIGWGWYDQFLMDYLPLNSPKLSFKRIEESIIWVTGRYSLKLPLHFGMRIAGIKVPSGIDEFADMAGALFQTGDDLIGLFGEVAKTGKSNFGDISQGKKTLPMWLSYDNSTAADKKTLVSLVGNKKITAKQAAQVRQIVMRSQGYDKSVKLMANYRQQCQDLLKTIQIPQDLSRFLTGLVCYLEKRDR